MLDTLVFESEVHGDPGAHALSITHLQVLCNSPQLCMDLLTSPTLHDDHCLRLCLEVVRRYLGGAYLWEASVTARARVHKFILDYARGRLSASRRQDRGLGDLVADVYRRAFFADYPSRWDGFVQSLTFLVNAGPRAALHFLRIMSHISDALSSPQNFVHLMRSSQVDELVLHLQVKDMDAVLHALCTILDNYSANVVTICLHTASSFLQWLDVSHIVDHAFYKKVALEFNSPETRLPAAQCYRHIMSRLSAEQGKTEIFLDTVFNELYVVHRKSLTVSYDDDFARELSNLLNAIGVKLVECCCKLRLDYERSSSTVLDDSVCCKFAHVISTIEEGDYKLTKSILPFTKDYMGYLRCKGRLSEAERQIVQLLLRTTLLKMKMDEGYQLCTDVNWEDEKDDLVRYRRLMCHVLHEITAVDSDLVFKELEDVVEKNLSKTGWDGVSFHEAEYQLYLLGELGTVFEGVWGLLGKMIASGIGDHPHPVVTARYFRTLATHAGLTLLHEEPSLLAPVLDDILTRGLRHSHPAVRASCAPALAQLLSACGPHLRTQSALVWSSLQDLLVPCDCALPMSRPAQLCLFKAATVAVTSGELKAAEQGRLIATLVMLGMERFTWAGHSLAANPDHEDLARDLCHGLAVVTAVARVFSSPGSVVSPGCEEMFMEALGRLETGAATPMYRADVQAATRRLVSSVLNCLPHRILRFIPRLLGGRLLCCPEPTCVIATADLFLDVVFALGGRLALTVGSFCGPALCYVFDKLSAAADNAPDEHIRNRLLKSRQISILTLLMALRDTGLLHFAVNSMEVYFLLRVFYMACVEAVDGLVPQHCGIALDLLASVVRVWKPRLGEASVFHVMCFVVRAEFSALGNFYEDSLYRHAAELLRVVHDKCGTSLVQWLQHDFLPSLNIPPARAEPLIRSLTKDKSSLAMRLQQLSSYVNPLLLADMHSFDDLCR